MTRQLFLAQRVQTRVRYSIVHLEREVLTAFIDARSLQVNRKILSLVAAFFLMILPVAVIAQSANTSAVGITSNAAVAPNATMTPNAAMPSAGPTTAASAVGIRAPVAQRSATAAAAAADPHIGAGQNIALMVVGGAALIIGAAIGDTAGILLAVGGAIVFLYGLYNFVQ